MSESRVTYTDLLRQRYVPGIVGSMLVSRCASEIWYSALILFVLIYYHSPLLAGFSAFLAIVPGLVVSPVMGALLDRNVRSTMILIDYLFATFAVLAIAALFALHHLSPLLLLLIVGVTSLTNTLSASGLRSALPTMLHKRFWDRANGLDALTAEVSVIIGPMVAGFAIGELAPEWVMLLVGILFATATFLISRVTIGAPNPSTAHVLSDSASGLRYVLSNPTLRGTALTCLAANLGSGALFVCLPLIVFTRLHEGAAVVGLLWTFGGVTAAASGIVCGKVDTEGREFSMVIFGLAMSLIALVLVAIGLNIGMLVAAMLVFGLSEGPINIAIWGLRQRRTAPEMFGRVIAIAMSLNFVGMPLGSAIGGALVKWSLPGTLWCAVCVTVLSLGIAAVLLPRGIVAPASGLAARGESSVPPPERAG